MIRTVILFFHSHNSQSLNNNALKEKLLREIAQEGNVSLLKLTKDVIKGKYDDFSMTNSNTGSFSNSIRSDDFTTTINSLVVQ